MKTFTEKSYEEKINFLQALSKKLVEFLSWDENFVDKYTEEEAFLFTYSIIELDTKLRIYNLNASEETKRKDLMSLVENIYEESSKFFSVEASYVKILSEEILKDSQELPIQKLESKLAQYQETVQGITPIILLRNWVHLWDSDDDPQKHYINIIYPGYYNLSAKGISVVPRKYNPSPKPLTKEEFEDFLTSLPQGKVKDTLSPLLNDYSPEIVIDTFYKTLQDLRVKAFVRKKEFLQELDELVWEMTNKSRNT